MNLSEWVQWWVDMGRKYDPWKSGLYEEVLATHPDTWEIELKNRLLAVIANAEPEKHKEWEDYFSSAKYLRDSLEQDRKERNR